MKKLFISVDDFGLTSEINAGIIALAQQGRVSAASCLVSGPAFHAGAAELADMVPHLGLHLNLTEALDSEQFHRPLGKLIIECFAGKVSSVEICAEIERQFDTFVAAFGRTPDYVDGHQHVHQLPIVRECLLRVLSERCVRHLPWLRSTRLAARRDFSQDALKARLIQMLGEERLRRRCEAGQFKMNSGLFGVYSFEGDTYAFLKRLRSWVADFEPDDLIMCHPAAAPNKHDVIGKQRHVEFLILGGAAFAETLQEQNATVVTVLDDNDNHFSCGTWLPDPLSAGMIAPMCASPFAGRVGKPHTNQIPDGVIT